VVVDDDIDAYDINDVLWAMCSRADPVDATEILRR
jgi:UbiD family decarboxylase